MSTNVYDVLAERGFIEQCTNPEEVRELLQKERFSGRTQLYAYMWAKE